MNEPAAIPTPGLWPSVWTLLRLRAQITFSGIRRANRRAKIGWAVLGIFLAWLLVMAFIASFAFLRFLRSPQLAEALPGVADLPARVPVILLQGGFLIILMTSFGVLLQALYLSGDMDFLLSAPVPVRAVFISKLLQAIVPNLALIVLAATPVLFGLGAAGGYNILYYPLTLVMLVALALAAAAISSLIVMGIVRIFPARRVAEVLGFVGAVITIVCSQSGNLAQRAISRTQALAALRLAVGSDTPWSPLAWAGRGLVGIGEGRWLAGLGFSALALGAAALVFGLALTTAERLYYSGWAGMQTRHRRKRTAPAARRASAQPLSGLAPLRLLPPAVGAIVAKDWAMLRRDLRNLSQLVTPLILGVVYALMLVRGGGLAPEGQGDSPALLMQVMKNATAYASIAIALFVGWTLLSRLAAMGFSQEGKSYWVLKAAPVSTDHLLAAKFLAAYLPALLLSWVFVIALSIVQRAGIAPSTLWFSLAIVALCQAGVTGIYLAFGISGANMDWDDPRKMVSGSAGCLGALLTAAALVVALALFALPQIGLTLLGWPTFLAQLAGLVLGGALCLACAIVPLRILRGRVALLGES